MSCSHIYRYRRRSPRMMMALDKGAKVMVVDPRNTPLSRLAAIKLTQRQNADIAWINGMVKVIMYECLHDEASVKVRTEAFEDLRKTIVDYHFVKIESLTGISSEKITEAARACAR